MKREIATLAVALAFFTSPALAEDPYNLAWARQLGTSSGDYIYGVATDATGNVFITGWTYGDLDGTNAGGGDAFLSKYDTLGNPVWTRQLGTSSLDASWAAATDANGNILISGETNGSIGGQSSAGSVDAFVRKYDASGNTLWTRQLGTSSTDLSASVATDASGNVFISGYTFGSLGGQSSVGGGDAFVSKYDALGNPLWTRQFGTSDYDVSLGVAADTDGNVFITGFTEGDLYGPNAGDAGTYDAFLSKYDTLGNPVWTRQLGTSSLDASWAAATDANGNILISGETNGSIGGQSSAGSVDAFVRKYDASGNTLWTRQLGTSSTDLSASVATDASGNVFISGYTLGDLDGTNAGGVDAFLSKYDTSGSLLWTRQLGTSSSDASWGVATDTAGNVFINGSTDGDLYGSNAGGGDAFLSKYDTLGNLLWTHQIGTSSNDDSRGVAVDAVGNVFISGFTYGSLGGQPSAGNYDAFVVKYNVPEPATLGLLLVGGLALIRRRRTKLRNGR